MTQKRRNAQIKFTYAVDFHYVYEFEFINY